MLDIAHKKCYDDTIAISYTQQNRQAIYFRDPLKTQGLSEYDFSSLVCVKNKGKGDCSMMIHGFLEVPFTKEEHHDISRG